MKGVILALVTIGLMAMTVNQAQDQRVGEKAELKRLEGLAKDSMESGDPEGATLNIGKAAMMAAILSQQATRKEEAQWFRALGHLYRAQEHVYRAYGLFERSGQAIPASSGVCSGLTLGSQELNTLSNQQSVHSIQPDRAQYLLDASIEWEQTIKELQEDFQCPS